ncbi:MAG TPA: hypothetical protein PKY59_24315 [Pyrinomonadaceae bacterium]|nr:hypothetical protein [Pyrinomonadaceae bacterium]
MLWKILNGNYLLRSRHSFDEHKLVSISDFSRYFGGKTAKEFLAKDIFNEIGEFYEIEVHRFFESKIEEMTRKIKTVSEIEISEFFQENPCKIVRRFRAPSTFSLEDHLYLSGLCIVENNNFIRYTVEEKACRTFDTEIRSEIVFEGLILLPEDFLPVEFQTRLLNEFKSKNN